MIQPDIITTNTYGLDYPYWRWLIEENRPLFNQVYAVLCQDNKVLNFREFIKLFAKHYRAIDIGELKSGDWRNQTTNAGLDKSTAEFVLFLEQDFIPIEDNFFEKVFEEMDDYDVAGFVDNGEEWIEGKRLHPAFLIVRRELIDKTSRDFSAYPKKDRDHFGIFTDELLALQPRFLDIAKYQWKHVAGTTSNYMLVAEGSVPNYKLEDFEDYVVLAMNVPVPQHVAFMILSKQCLEIIEKVRG